MFDWKLALDVGKAASSPLELLRGWVARKVKRSDEIHQLCVRVVFSLETYAESCLATAIDDGEDDEFGHTFPYTKTPDLLLRQGADDWLLLDRKARYEVMKLEEEVKRATAKVDQVAKAVTPDESSAYFAVRQPEFLRLGFDSLTVAAALRKYAKLPHDDNATRIHDALLRRRETLKIEDARRRQHWDEFQAFLAASKAAAQQPGATG